MSKKLIEAIETGDLSLIEKLLLSGANPNYSRSIFTPLTLAISLNSSPKLVELLISQGADVNMVDRDGCFAIHHAALWGFKSQIEVLIKYGADVNVKSAGPYAEGENVTALMLACSSLSSQFLDIIKLLIQHGADVKSCDTLGRTPLIHLCLGVGGRKASLMSLQGGQSQFVHNISNLIKQACMGSNNVEQDTIEAIQLLLKAGVALNATDVQGRTALSIVQAGCHTNLVHTLESLGAVQDNANAQQLPVLFKPDNGASRIFKLIKRLSLTDKELEMKRLPRSLCNAVIDGDVNSTRRFLEAGGIKDRDKYEALVYAAAAGKLDTVRLLVTSGAPIKSNNTFELLPTPLQQAVNNGHEKVVQFLLAHGYTSQDVVVARQVSQQKTISNKAANTFFEAAKNVFESCHGFFQEKPAEPHERDDIMSELLNLIKANSYNPHLDALQDFGESALIIAAKSGLLEVVRALLDSGADPNRSSDLQRTALMESACNCFQEVVNLLIIRGANVNSVDRSGYTALMFAVEGGDLEIVDILLRAGADPTIKNDANMTALSSYINRGPYWKEIQGCLKKANKSFDMHAKQPKQRGGITFAPTDKNTSKELRNNYGFMSFVNLMKTNLSDWVVYLVGVNLGKTNNLLKDFCKPLREERNLFDSDLSDLKDFILLLQLVAQEWTFIPRFIGEKGTVAHETCLKESIYISARCQVPALVFFGSVSNNSVGYEFIENGKILDKAEWYLEGDLISFSSTRCKRKLKVKSIERLFRDYGMLVPPCMIRSETSKNEIILYGLREQDLKEIGLLVI